MRDALKVPAVRSFARWGRRSLRALAVALLPAVIAQLPLSAQAQTQAQTQNQAQVQAQVAATERSCPPQAQIPDPAAVEKLIRTARDRGVLWRLEKDGNTSWLYGTIHIAQREWLVPGPTVLQALKASDTLALELNLLDPQVQGEIASAMQRSAADKAGKPSLPQPLQDRLAKIRRSECVDELIGSMRPEAQVVTLATLMARREGLDPTYGIDIWLAGTAVAMRKPIIGLESVKTQLKILVADDRAKMLETVERGLDQLERADAPALLTRLASAWADGRMALLESYPQWCECLSTPAERRTYDEMVNGRNPGIARAIVKEIQAGKSLFAAVGALHMVGSQGLPALLKRQGFKVTRVEFGESISQN